MSKLRIIRPKNPAPEEELLLKKHSQHELVLMRPGMYIGSVRAVETVRYVYDTDTNKVVKRKIMYIDGLDRLPKEIISNAADNGVRSRQLGINPGEINVTMDKHTITVRNGGRPFSITKFDGTDKYTIQVAYDEFGTSTNYDDKNRIGVAGMNGLGSKLTNTYSTWFQVIAVNNKQKKRYEQTWTNNKFNVTEPKITPSNEVSCTQVSYTVDFSRFPDSKGEYIKDFFDLVAFDCLCFSFTTKIPVTFNGIRFDVFNPVDFAKMVYGETVNFITLTETMKKDGSDAVDKVWKESNRTPIIKYDPLDFALTDIVICDTPDAGDIISFANGMYTTENGVHVNAIVEKIKRVIIPFINMEVKGVKMTVKDLLPHISIIISCYLRNPEIKGQMKSYLSSPQPKFDSFQPALIENMTKWNLIECLKSAAAARQQRKNNKESLNANINKAVQADRAGTKESYKCTLYLTEGDSAKTYVMKMLKYKNGGSGIGEYSGVFPLRGKVKNLMKLKDEDVIADKNEEWLAVKKLMGFKGGVVYDNLEKITRDWRYGNMCIVTDADPDGKHIFGTVIGNLKKTIPEFLINNRLRHIRTPAVRVTKGKQMLNFLTEQEYEQWAAKNLKGWEIKYCKGLGSSKDLEIKEDSKDIKQVQMIYDEKASEYIDIALTKTHIKQRKQWMDAYVPYHGIEKLKELDISLFFDKEFIEHSIVNMRRSIPGMDGFKVSQRKIFYTALNKWKTRPYVIKTATLASATVERTQYHHGETSLQEAINGMTWDWAGSNNMPYFASDGQFGSRIGNGKDAAAARYTSVNKIWWTDFVFSPLDACIYDYAVEDQEKVEPIIFYPILPMIMINGAWGVGTGWASFIPNYNPENICDWLLQRLSGFEGKELPNLEPWWKGFKGDIKETIQVEIPKKEGDNTKKQYVTKNIMEPDIVDFDEDAMVKRRAVIDGIYKEYGPNKVVIEEIPIGRSIEWYKKHLDEMKKCKELTKIDYSGTDDEHINIVIHGLKNPSLSKLKLRRAFGMTSMVILDEAKKPQRYRSAAELIEVWFQWRFPFFQERLNKLVEIEEKKIGNLRDKAKLIEAILLGNDKGHIPGKSIVVIREPVESIRAQMEVMDLDYSIFKEVKFSNCTKEGLDKVSSQCEEAENNLLALRKTTPTEAWTREIKIFLTEYRKQLEEENKKKISEVEKKNKSTNKRVRNNKRQKKDGDRT